jgi:predicted membrane protein
MPIANIKNLSIETEQRLHAVIKKKKKKDRYESLRNTYLIASLLLLFGFFAFLNFAEIKASFDPFSTFANIIVNPFYLIIMTLIALFFVYHNYYQKKLKKEKDKLNAVRIEVIDYLDDSKNMNLQEQVALIKKVMKEEYDINLYVKNK